jgi:transforming growth factor-beta-induced protein
MKCIKLLLALACAGFVAACGDGSEDPPPAESFSAALNSTGRTSELAAAVEASGLKEQLEGSQRYTLLIPSDEALAPFADELSDLGKPENREALQKFVRAHVIDGKKLAADLSPAAGGTTNTNTVQNLLGEDVDVVVSGGEVTINGAPLQTKDIQVRNGALHVLSAPLFRPSVASVLRELPQTSTLDAAVASADLLATLRGNGTFTLFAPTNEAFDALLAELNVTAEALLANKPLLTQVLTYHVLATSVLDRQIEDGATPDTVQGQALKLSVPTSTQVKITDARGRVVNVTRTNIRAGNGVVHLIDRVMLPSDKNVVEVAAAKAGLGTLIAALQAARLEATLRGRGPFTVLAPNDSAFALLLRELNITSEQLLADTPLLTKVLNYHVLPTRSLRRVLDGGAPVTTVQGQTIALARDGQLVTVTDSNGRRAYIGFADLQGTNGVVHVIDRVLLPN